MENVKLVTIEEVCISGSSNISQNKLLENEGDYPIYGASGLIKNVDFYHQDRPYLSIVKDGSGYGRITIMPGKTSVIGTLQYILPKENIMLNYLYYAMLSIDFKKYVSGAAIPHIYFRDYKKEVIILRPLEEQQQIVEKLDKAFELIDQAKANIEQNIINAKELFQSKLDEVFSGNTTNLIRKKFEDICILQRGYDLPKKDRYEGEYELVSSNGVTDYISEYKLVGPGVITGRSGTIGKVHFIENNYWPLNTALYIKDFKGNVPKYIYYFLQSINLSIYASGAGVPTLNRNFVHSEYFTITEDIDMQIQSIRVLDDLQENIKYIVSKYQQKLSNLEELRKSILEKAFKGELTH